MQISWEVEDGYVGKSRPQHTDIHIDYILDGYDDEEFTEENIDNLVEDVLNNEVEPMVQDDFADKISWNFRNYDEVKSEIEKAIRERLK